MPFSDRKLGESARKKNNQVNVKVLDIKVWGCARSGECSRLANIETVFIWKCWAATRAVKGIVWLLFSPQSRPHKTKMSGMSGRTQCLPLGYFLILAFISYIYLVKPLRRTNNESIYKKINEPASRRHLHCSSASACRHRSWPQFHLCSSCRGIWCWRRLFCTCSLWLR